MSGIWHGSESNNSHSGRSLRFQLSLLLRQISVQELSQFLQIVSMAVSRRLFTNLSAVERANKVRANHMLPLFTPPSTP